MSTVDDAGVDKSDQAAPTAGVRRKRRARVNWWFVSNLTLVVAIVIVTPVWLNAYTDWVRTISDWLKLLGVAAVAGAVFKYVRKYFGKRLEPVRDLLAARGEKLLYSKRVVVVLVALICLEAVLMAQTGSVWAKGEKGKRIWPYDRNGNQAEEAVTSEGPEKEVRRPYWTGFGERRVNIRFEGYPAQSVTLRPLVIMRVSPKWAPAVPLAIARYADKFPDYGEYRLEITRTGSGGDKETFSLETYHGEPVVLGCGDDLVLPPQFKDLASGRLRTPDQGAVVIRAKDTLVVTLVKKDTKGRFVSAPASVGEARNNVFDEVVDVPFTK